MSALAEDNHLLQAIRGRDRHLIFSPDSMYCLFDILVGSLRFLCIDHINIVIFLHASLSAFDPVSVKYKDQIYFFIALIVT